MRVKRTAYAKLEPEKVIIVDATRYKGRFNSLANDISKYLSKEYPEIDWSRFMSEDKFIWYKPKPKQSDDFMFEVLKFLNYEFADFEVVIGSGDWK